MSFIHRQWQVLLYNSTKLCTKFTVNCQIFLIYYIICLNYFLIFIIYYAILTHEKHIYFDVLLKKDVKIMARKSRETLLRERLRSVSSCPFDIIDSRCDHERLFSLIEKAEAQDTRSLRALIADTMTAHLENRSCSESLLYFLRRAIRLGDTDAASTLIGTPSLICRDIPLCEEAVELLRGIADPSYERTLTDGVALIMLAKAESDEECAQLLPPPNTLTEEEYPTERFFILSRAERGRGGTAYSLVSVSLIARLGLPLTYGIIIPSADDNTEVGREDVSAEIDIIKGCITRYNYTQWTDFWLECLYKLCDKYLSGKLGAIAETAISVITDRDTYPERELHILAWYSYLIDSEEDSEKKASLLRKYDSLKEICLFSGVEVGLSEDRRLDLMKRSVSLCTADETAKAIRTAMRGTEIVHTRNRYLLTHELNGHIKRGRLHIWEHPLSMKADKSLTEPPKFNKLRVVRTSIDISRGGITLERRRDCCQIFCESEIQIGNALHPIELDLILDISYVSATKCGECEIRVKRYSLQDGYLVMDCQIVLY